MRPTIEINNDAYSLTRKFVVTFGMNHLVYGATPEEAAENYHKLIQRL